jgi:uncharacterized membrane protein (DUF4010 family)
MDYLLIRNFLIALLIGALVGMEREKKKVQEAPETRGLRSFILIAEAGAISAWLSLKLAIPWIFVATLISAMVLILSGYVLPPRETRGDYGMTTEIASLVTFLLGGMTLFGYPELAVALGIIASLILAYKEPLHGLVAKIGTDDLSAILKLLVATFIVLPFLPDRPVDPLGALNPYSLWFLVILISGLSLVGYVAVRWLGPKRGTAITGLAGGLVSSTAVTLSFSKRSREKGSQTAGAALATGILLAWGIMFVRVVIEVAVVHLPLVRSVLFPFAAMAITATLVAALIYRGMGRVSPGPVSQEEVSLKNPFSLTSAVRFALFFALVLVLVKLAERYFPGQGIYGVAALAGLTDVDAITLSMAQSVRQGGSAPTAVTAITLAAITNTLVKTGIVLLLSQGGLRKRILFGSLAIFAAGVGALLIFK